MKLQETESKAVSGISHETATPHFTDISEGLQVRHIVDINALYRNEHHKCGPRRQVSGNTRSSKLRRSGLAESRAREDAYFSNPFQARFLRELTTLIHFMFLSINEKRHEENSRYHKR